MFQNCLLLDLTVIDLMSIVYMDKIWVGIAKKFEMRTSGEGGWSVISDTPRRGWKGDSKKGEFLRTSFMDGHYCISPGWSPSDLFEFFVAVQCDILCSSSLNTLMGFLIREFWLYSEKLWSLGYVGSLLFKRKS